MIPVCLPLSSPSASKPAISVGGALYMMAKQTLRDEEIGVVGGSLL